MYCIVYTQYNNGVLHNGASARILILIICVCDDCDNSFPKRGVTRNTLLTIVGVLDQTFPTHRMVAVTA